MNTLTLRNKDQSITFAPEGGGYRPEWFRLGDRPMLRFKDHTWLNIGAIEVAEGALLERSETRLRFGGRVELGGTPVDWEVAVAIPADGKAGFEITSSFTPVADMIEVLEGLSTFETPYEYDGNEHLQTFIAQQPMYRLQDGQVINGSGWVHPNWYYGRAGKVHLTYPSSSPLMVQKAHNADGSNVRYTMFIGNWDICSIHDLFGHPTRNLKDNAEDLRFASDPHLQMKPGRRGFKFLVGAANWNSSLHKDPNWLVEPGRGLRQQVIVDFCDQPRGGRWDTYLAEGWERLCRLHFPHHGLVPAHEVHKSRGASWTNAATWLTAQFEKKEGCPGFFYTSPPENAGTCVYGPHTRPNWGGGSKLFSAQWTGPTAYLGHVWDKPSLLKSASMLEGLAVQDKQHEPERIWTIGPTPMYCAVLRKWQVAGVSPEMAERIREYVRRRTKAVVDPAPSGKRGDAGIHAWDAYLNLLAADFFDRDACLSAARTLLEKVLDTLDNAHWSFNCAAEGDLVGADNARPFGHAIAATACLMAHQKLGDEKYRTAAERLGNIMLASHFITWNESPSPDLDTRGWCHGSTGGRDQWAQIPPWETGFTIQQFAPLMLAGIVREGFLDVMWLFARTGLAQFPIARTMKRLYRPDMSIEYRPIDAIATEREFYLKLPYLAYENPWDQTMLAGYQGVEPLILSVFMGGGLVRCEDPRVSAIVPEAAVYEKNVRSKFEAILWNPTREAIETRLHIAAAAAQRRAWRAVGVEGGAVEPADPVTGAVVVPPRQIKRIQFEAATS